MRLVKLSLVAISLGLVIPLICCGLLSFSESSGLDIFVRFVPSLRWWTELIHDPSWLNAAITSLAAGSLCAALSLFLVLPVALAARLGRNRSALWVASFACISVLVPPISLAVGMSQLISALGLFDTIVGLSLAHLAVAVPIVVAALFARFYRTPNDMYRAALSLGASPFGAAVRWLIATQSKTIVATFALGILASISEATLTLYVTDTSVVTIARRTMSGVGHDLRPTGFAALVASLLFVGLFSIPVSRFVGRKV